MSFTPAEEAAIAHQHRLNEDTAKYYGIAIGGLILIFIFSHWSKVIFDRYGARSHALSQAIARVTRPARRALNTKLSGPALFLSGRVAVTIVYFGINLGLLFQHLELGALINVAKRFGWLALCNMTLTIFLGLKNTPLSPFAGHSYESLNVLHRCAGYTTIAMVVFHASIESASFAQLDELAFLIPAATPYGLVAGVCFLLILISSIRLIRERQYEMFYIAHVTLVALALVTVGFHQPDFSNRAVIVTILAAAIWAADRSFRFSRWMYYGLGNYCTLTPLPHGATRVLMRRSIRARPGMHAFLWIPGVRSFQTHPFTLLSTYPAEFVIAGRDGFTSELHHKAKEHPGVKFRASFEGPYGALPDINNFDKVLLISGGSGATFTLALALEFARRTRPISTANRALQFVWTVKSKAHLQWFAKELAELQACPAIDLIIHVTQSSLGSSSPTSPTPTSEYSVDIDKAIKEGNIAPLSEISSLAEFVEERRPDVAGIVNTMARSASTEERVFVAGSGPAGLLSDVRKAATACMISNGPSVTLHLEEFGW